MRRTPAETTRLPRRTNVPFAHVVSAPIVQVPTWYWLPKAVVEPGHGGDPPRGTTPPETVEARMETRKLIEAIEDKSWRVDRRVSEPRGWSTGPTDHTYLATAHAI